MTTTRSTRRIPNPIYAAAGAGDLAYQQLRKIPSKVAELRERAVELRPAVSDAVSETNLRVDLDRLRDVARRNATAVVNGAQAAQERAVAVYEDLVKRGRKVVRDTDAAEATVAIAPAKGTVTAKLETEPAPAKKAAPAKKTAAK